MRRARLGAALGAAVLLASGLSACSGGSDDASDAPRPISSAALSAGLRVTLSATANGRLVTFTAAVQDDDGAAPGYVIDYGDGKTQTVPAPRANCAAGTRTAATPIKTTIESEHTYAKPGSYPVTITVTSGGGCPLPAAETVQALTLASVS